MPPALIAAAPGIASGVIGLFGNRKSGAEKQLEANTAQQSQMANMISQIAQNQHSMAGPALNKAMQYYTTLASGNRGALNSALAPERNQMMEAYKGAERGMTSRMERGPSQERAVAELYRQRAGQSAMMPMMAKNAAFGNLAGLGTDILREGNQLYGTAGSILSGSTYGLNSLANMQNQRAQGWTQFGQSMGNVFLPWLLGKVGGGGGTLVNSVPKLPPTQAPSVPGGPNNPARNFPVPNNLMAGYIDPRMYGGQRNPLLMY